MSRPTTQPNQRVTLEEHTPRPVGLTVEARITDGGHSVNQQRIAGLDAVAGFFADKAAKRADELRASQAAQGVRDANLDAVDQQLVTDNETYRKAVSRTRGQRQSMEWYNSATQALAQAQREDPNMDFNAWREQNLAALYGDDDDADSLGAKNAAAAQLESNLRGQFESRRAKAEHDQAINEWAGVNRAALDGGAVRSSAAIDSLLANAAPLGIGEDEARVALAQQLVAQIELGDTSLYPLLADSKSKLHLDGEWGARLEKAHELGTKRREQADAEAKLLKGEDQLRAVDSINRLADRGRFGLADALKYEGQLTNGFLTSAMERSVDVINRAREKAERAVEKTREATERNALIARHLAAGTAGQLYGSGIKPSDVQDVLDGSYYASWSALQAANADNDGQSAAEAAQHIASVIETAQRNGLIPNALKFTFDNADPANPQAFGRVVENFRTMRANGLDSYLDRSISGKANALLMTASDLMEAGMSSVDAAQMLKDRLVPDERVSQAINYNGRKLDDASRRLSNGSGKSTLVRTQLQPYVESFLRAGDSYDVAEVKGRKLYEKNFKTIGGWPMRLGDVPEDFPDVANEWINTVLKPTVAERFGTDAGFTLAPIAGAPGKFYIVPAEGGFDVLRGEDRQPLWVDYANMTTAVTQRRQERKAANYERDQLFDQYRREALFDPM